MPAFLVTIFKWVGGLLIQVVGEKLADFIKARQAKIQQKKEIEEEVKRSIEALKKAEDAKAIDDATRDALNKL